MDNRLEEWFLDLETFHHEIFILLTDTIITNISEE